MPKSYIAKGELMTMQIRTAAGKREVNKVLRRYQSSGNDRIEQTQTWDVIGLRSYRNTET